MSLTAIEMKRLDEEAREMADGDCRTYLSDAVQCLRDTGDPIAALELLLAMWGSGHARRDQQKLALDDAGHWLEQRLAREPGIELERLAFEIGWLRRLVTVHHKPRGAGHARQDGPRPPRAPSFGAGLEQLRRRRALALSRAAAETPGAALAPAERAASSASAPRPERLPASFEVCFVKWEDALEAFRNARKRRKDGKQPKPRLLPVRPVAAELEPLAAGIECSMLDTEGMDALAERTVANAGQPPAFWIAAVDLIEREGKRVPRRITLAAT